MEHNDGGPWAPVWEMNGNGQMELTCTGASMRDVFAVAAMQAAATNPAGAEGFTFDQRAEWAYQQADAMLKARQGASNG